ncbi:MAG: 50S ribosomal protein L29 [Candidatus Altiarchaeota archaeon]
MAVLNAKTIWDMGLEEIEERLTQMESELMKIRGVLSSGGIPEDVGKAREIKRTIGRLNTIKAIKQKKENEQPAKPEKKAAKNTQKKQTKETLKKTKTKKTIQKTSKK